ncbi:flavin reductase family protein [Streptomyces sp. O3]
MPSAGAAPPTAAVSSAGAAPPDADPAVRSEGALGPGDATRFGEAVRSGEVERSGDASGAGPGEELRSVARRLAAGVTVVTSGTGDAVHGMTVSSFTTLSLTPPLVSFSVKSGARIRGLIETTGAFVVNLLAAEQEPLARWFADPDRPTGAAGFEGRVRTAGAPGGGPLLSGVVGYFACRLDRLVEAGDHIIVIGGVERCETLRPATVPALVFAGGGFHTLAPRPPS